MGKKKEKRTVAKAVVHVKATFNNTYITVADIYGETLCWASAGTVGFKGSRKSTPFAAQRAARNVAERARKRFGVKEVEVRVKGDLSLSTVTDTDISKVHFCSIYIDSVTTGKAHVIARSVMIMKECVWVSGIHGR